MHEAIEQAKAYVRGERAQGFIDFDEDPDPEFEADSPEGEELVKVPRTPKRGKKAKAAAEEVEATEVQP